MSVNADFSVKSVTVFHSSCRWVDGTAFSFEEKWVKNLLLDQDLSPLMDGPICLAVVGRYIIELVLFRKPRVHLYIVLYSTDRTYLFLVEAKGSQGENSTFRWKFTNCFDSYSYLCERENFLSLNNYTNFLWDDDAGVFVLASFSLFDTDSS